MPLPTSPEQVEQALAPLRLQLATDLLKRLAQRGCPTYTCNDGRRWLAGAQCCFYCDEAVGIGHTTDCEFLQVIMNYGDKTVFALATDDGCSDEELRPVRVHKGAVVDGIRIIDVD